MTYTRTLLITCILFFFTISITHANDTINRWQAFIYFADKIEDNIPESYKYIDLYYRWVSIQSPEWKALQKLVYMWHIGNKSVDLKLGKNIDFRSFEALATKILELQVVENISNQVKQNTFVRQSDLEAIEEVLKKREQNTEIKQEENLNIESFSQKTKILSDVYNTLHELHYDRNNFTQDQVINGAIQWAAESIWDKYTTYFPPVESKSFLENLDGSFEGIWAYIEMQSPWELIIISPIVDSPAEKSWLKGWDKILAVDGKEISEDVSTNEAVSWIKWPKGTQVELTIKREGIKENFKVVVIRDTIIIKDVEHEKLNSNTYYIQIKSFWDDVTKQFKQSLEAISQDTSIKKIIIDVRNNPGWYLNEVAYMLSYFVPKGEATVQIDYGESDTQYKSLGFELINPSSYELVILQNTGSASASEILVGTLKDYFPDATIIWENSFGKWSVQSLKNYYDGSTLKYTSAKWFTGKTKTWIDWVWIAPDIEVILDEEQFRENEIDNQLEAAKKQ